MDRDWTARLRAMENPGAPAAPGTWEADAPALATPPRAAEKDGPADALPHHHMTPIPTRAPPIPAATILRDHGGILAQVAAFVALAALALT